MPDSGTFVNTTYGNANAYTGVVNTTNEMSPGMKVYWDTEMLENTREKLVYAQFGKKHRLPANHGMQIEWRKWKTIPDIDRLIEGVIPEGKSFGQTSTRASIAQYGAYVTISEQLDMKHVDPVITGAQQELAAAAAKKLDTLHRDGILAAATNVLYADVVDKTGNYAYVSTPLTMYELTNQPNAAALLTPDMVAKAKTILEGNNVPKINGRWYVCVINPFAKYDLMRHPEWNDFHKYSATEEIFNGEVGELYGVRFVETTQAPVMVGDPLYNAAQRYLTISGYTTLSNPGVITNGFGEGSMYRFTVTEDLSQAGVDYDKLIGQYVLFSDAGTIDDRLIVTGVDVTGKYIYTETAPTDGSAASGDYLLPGNGGAESQTANAPVAVFASMFFGQDAFGIIDPDGGAIQMIIKNKGQIGGPLEQFSTVGTKMETGTKLLYQERALVMYHTGAYSDRVKPNWRL